MTVPAPTQALLAPAFAALTLGDFRGAATALELAVSADPGLAVAHEMLGGLSLGVLDDYPRALQHFEISYRYIAKLATWPLPLVPQSSWPRSRRPVAMQQELAVGWAGRRG
jgi:hypothetical protein